MAVRGKSKYDWEYRTYCDFGTVGRKSVVSRHYSLRAAQRAFQQLRKRYSRDSNFPDRFLWRCWQEDRRQQVINDTGAMIFYG